MCRFKRYFEKVLPSKYPELFEGAIVFGSIKDIVFVETKGNKYALKLNQNFTDSHITTSTYCQSVVGKQLWAHQIVHKDVPVLSVFPDIVGTCKLVSGEEFSYFCMEWSADQNPEVGLHGMSFSLEKCTKYFYPEYKNEGLAFLEKVGRIAALINQTSTDSFGGGPKNWVDRFIVEDSRFEYGKWGDFVRSYVTRIDFELLESEGVISAKQHISILAVLDELAQIDFEPKLIHGDLVCNLLNFLLDKNGNISAVIDWPSCGSGPAPQMEIAGVILQWCIDGWTHDCIKENLCSFLKGYGILDSYNDTYRFMSEAITCMYCLEFICRIYWKETYVKQYTEGWTRMRDFIHLFLGDNYVYVV